MIYDTKDDSQTRMSNIVPGMMAIDKCSTSSRAYVHHTPADKVDDKHAVDELKSELR